MIVAIDQQQPAKVVIGEVFDQQQPLEGEVV